MKEYFILLVAIAVCCMCVVYWRTSFYVSIHKIRKDETPLSISSGILTNASSTNRRLQYSPKHSVDIQNNNNTKRYHLCFASSGRLGNHMFQFAVAYSIAKNKHMRLVLKKNHPVRQIFKLQGQFEDNTLYCRLARRVIERKPCTFDQRLLNISGRMDYFIGTYLQSWKYFQRYEKDLRKQFVFKNHTYNIALHVIKDLLKKYSKHRSKITLIGIHVRRGDMVNNPYGYQVATKEYFEKAIAYYRRKFKDAIFVVCSNGMKWAKENLDKTNKLVFIENNTPEVDLAVLGLCDHVIQSVGSFSWWGAWLAGGTSVFFKWPAKEGSGLRKDFSKDYSDYFYPGWIGMR